MKKKYKVLKAFGTHKVGTDENPTIVELDESEATSLLSSKSIEELKQTPEEMAADEFFKGFHTRLTETVEEVIKAGMAKAAGALRTRGARVSATSDEPLEDPDEGVTSVGQWIKSLYATKNGRDLAGFDSMAKYIDIRTRKLKAVTGANEGISEEGGLLVPTVMSREIMRKIFGDENDIMGRIRKFPVATGNSMTFKYLKETSRTEAIRFGGVLAYWLDEGEQYQASKAKWGKMELKLNKVGALLPVTDEIQADTTGITLAQFLTQLGGEAIAFKEKLAVMLGDGNGKPKGVLKSPALLVIAKETGQAAGSIVADNILKMWESMPVASRANSVWVINPDMERFLYGLHIKFPITNLAGSENVGGSVMPMYIPPGGLSGQPYGTLLGRPVIPLDILPGMGSEGDIGLYDFSQYFALVKGEAVTSSSIHLRFDFDEIVYKITHRIDGNTFWEAPVAPYATATSRQISPFVTLAVRA